MGREGQPHRGGRGRGRGRSRGQGRGFRPSGSGRNGSNNKADIKFYPHSAGRQQTVTYDSVKDHIIQKIRKTYEQGYDVATTLRDLKKKDFNDPTIKPVKQVSAETDETARVQEQDAMDILFKSEVDEFVKRKAKYNDNLKKAYADIMGYCSKTIQHRIETHVDYVSKIQDDPIELLKAIKNIMHDPEHNKYPFASLTTALLQMVNIKQQEKESLIDYIKRVKQAKDVLVSHVAADILNTFIEHTEEYQKAVFDTDKAQMKKEAFGRWMAYLTLKNSDQKRYGSLVTVMASQYSMKTDQYPANITEAADIMNNHKHDNAKKLQQARDHNRNHDRGPQSSSNESSDTMETSFAQMGEGKCYCCGKRDHYSNECPQKNKPKTNGTSIAK